MALYEYQCQSCGARTETIQSWSDPPLTTCEGCGGALVKLLSSPAFQFKGTGWYVSDYARAGKGTGPEAKSDGGEGAKSPAAEGSSGKEAAPAAKTDATPASGSESKPAAPAAKSE